MASPDNPEAKVTTGGNPGNSGFGFDCEGKALAELESDVKQMADRIAEYRANLPEQLRSTLASILSVQVPVCPDVGNGLAPVRSVEQNLDVLVQFRSNKDASLECTKQKDADKWNLLRQKISSNLSAVPVVIKTMKVCVAALENLESSHGAIPESFKRKTT